MDITLPRGTRVPDLALKCGVHPASMYRALNDYDARGVHNCSPALAVAIHYATEGAVTCWSLRPDLWAAGQVPPAPHFSSSGSAA